MAPMTSAEAEATLRLNDEAFRSKGRDALTWALSELAQVERQRDEALTVSDEDEVDAIRRSIEDIKAGRFKPLKEVRAVTELAALRAKVRALEVDLGAARNERTWALKEVERLKVDVTAQRHQAQDWEDQYLALAKRYSALCESDAISRGDDR